MNKKNVKNELTEDTFFLQRLVDGFLRKLKREKRDAEKDAKIDFLLSQLNKEPQKIPVEKIEKVIKDKLED